MLVYLCSELLAFAGYVLVKQRAFSWADYQFKRQTIIQSPSFTPPNYVAQGGGAIQTRGYRPHVEVIHPYLGFVVDPKTFEGTSEYGFRGQGQTAPITEKTDKNVIIGIFGGSFAAGTSSIARNVITEQIQRLPKFQNKKYIVHILAWGGYKQPQQLLALTYFLSLGAHFDIVINLDGFNEVALPAYENIPKQVFPFFPRNWFRRVHKFQEPEMLTMIGEITLLAERRKGWAQVFADTPLRYNIFCNLLWEYYDTKLANQRIKQEVAFGKHKVQEKDSLSYLVTGPSFHYASESELYQDLARVWKRCSVQMSNLCVANGIEYFHFLQPNQYVANSKIMKQEERKVAFAESHPYKKGVEKGYPYLLEEGKALQQHGVRFYDLTMIFATNDEPLYADKCCHLNKKGYKIIGQTIGETIYKEVRGKREKVE